MVVVRLIVRSAVVMMGCLSLDCLINCGGSEFDCLIGGGRGDKIGHDL